MTARELPLSQSNHKTYVIWKGRGGLLCYSPTFPRLRASHGRAFGSCALLNKQQGSWKLLRAAEENAWPKGIEPKTSTLVPC
jgi:hypothetical protein